MKLLLQAPMNPFSGYGLDGIGLARRLHAVGVDVYLEPNHVAPPWPREVAALLAKPLEPPFDMILQHWDPMQLEVTDAAASASDVNVGWTMWEYTKMDNAPLGARNTLIERLGGFSAVGCYDENTRHALAPYAEFNAASPTPLVVAQGGYMPEDHPFVERDWRDGQPFRFCMVGVLSERKDPFVAIEAFRELKLDPAIEFEDAELHLKTGVATLAPQMEDWCPKLRVHYANWQQPMLRQFMNNCHVLLAPSRGEGKNMPALEMLSSGGTVIATNWGGHTGWLRDDYAYKLDYALRAEPGTVDTMAARASKEHLKELMLRVYNNRAEARDKGRIGARIIPQDMSWEKAFSRLLLGLQAPLGHAGQNLWGLYQSALQKQEAARDVARRYAPPMRP